ncbi:zinc-finger associated domain (zf-AD) domain-containing protein [Phthorimaea operculella]|nr:zinc-finger associated domain (zf-AD) domain-containing protein [Phthorimaea operculella]
MATADSGKTSGQCRGCLKRGLHRKLTDACDIHGQIKLYRELFLDCFNLQMATNTNLTDLICTGCICRLNDAIDFKTQVEESEKQLLSQIALNNKYAAPNEQFLVEFSPPNTVFINEMKEMADTDDQVEVEDDIKLSEIRGLSDSSVTAKRNEKTLDLSDKANISGDLHTEELTLKVEPEEVDPVEVKEEPDDNLDYEDDTQQYEEDIQPGTLLSIELEVEEKQYHGTPSTHKTVNRHIPEERRKTSPIKESEHVEMSTNKILFGTGLQQCNQKNITNKKPSTSASDELKLKEEEGNCARSTHKGENSYVPNKYLFSRDF